MPGLDNCIFTTEASTFWAILYLVWITGVTFQCYGGSSCKTSRLTLSVLVFQCCVWSFCKTSGLTLSIFVFQCCEGSSCKTSGSTLSVLVFQCCVWSSYKTSGLTLSVLTLIVFVFQYSVTSSCKTSGLTLSVFVFQCCGTDKCTNIFYRGYQITDNTLCLPDFRLKKWRSSRSSWRHTYTYVSWTVLFKIN